MLKTNNFFNLHLLLNCLFLRIWFVLTIELNHQPLLINLYIYYDNCIIYILDTMSSKGGKKEETKKVEATKKEAAPSTGSGNVMDDLSKKQAFKKFSYRGEDIGKLLSLNMDELA